MKKIYSFLIFVSLIIFSTSCSEDLELTKLGDTDNVNPPVITSPVEGTIFTLNIDTPQEVAMTVKWNEPDYGKNLSIRYYIEIAKEGTSFENPVEIGTSYQNTFTITHVNLNNKLLSLGLSPDKEANFDLRIRTSVNYQIKEQISAILGLSATPYFDPSVLPEELYMTGASLNGIGNGGWNWNTNYAKFISVHSHPELFWTVVWLDPTVQDAGVKIAPQRAWVGDFGVDGDAVDGVWKKGGNNIIVPSAGYYTVVVDYINETVEVNEAKIYGIGDVFGSWDSSTYAFEIDAVNKVIKYSGDVNAGELRMHVAASTLKCDWWQAEFIILNDEIAYRGTGNDQERVAISAGTATISLDFIHGTGSIVQN